MDDAAGVEKMERIHELRKQRSHDQASEGIVAQSHKKLHDDTLMVQAAGPCRNFDDEVIQ